MKKLYFALMALGLSLTANADYYLIGEGVNDAKWSLKAADALMTETSAGVYEWSGTSLKSGFKINDGTWDNANANFGSNGSPIVLGEAYSYTVGSNSGNIGISGQDEVTNPKVVLDTNAGTITLTGDGSGIVVVGKEVYLAGEFNSYTAGDANYKFTEEGEGVYTLSLPTFASDFKVIYDGAWLGYADAPIQSGVAVTLGDTGFQNSTLASNPANNVKFSFNATDKSLVVTYDAGGDDPQPPTPVTGYEGWYLNIVGPFNNWQCDGVTFDSEGVATFAGAAINAEGFKVKVWNGTKDIWYNTDGSAVTVGTPVTLFEDVYDLAPMKINDLVDGNLYSVTFNAATCEMTVRLDQSSGIESVEAAEGEAVYFNLQGVQVENPVNGVYVKVLNGKATKVVVK